MGSVYLLLFINKFILFLISSQHFNITMKAFIILAVAAMGYAAPAADPQLLQSGLPAGPLTPAWGNGVLTPRGVRPINLEGFSEDVNQDGFVDPIGHAVAPVAVAAPAVHYAASPVVNYALPAVKPVEVKVEKVEPVEIKAAPVVTYAAAPALAAPVHYAAPAVYHQQIVHRPVATHTYTVPVSTHTETVHVGTHTYTNTLPHVLGAGAPILGGLPVVAAAKPADEVAVAEE